MSGGTINRFEDLKAWQVSRELISKIYNTSNNTKFNKDVNLREQIRRAVISINLNIAEGFARGADKEFRRFLMMARGSAAEVQAALYIALDLHYISKGDFDELYAEFDHVSRMIAKLAKYLDDKN